MGYVRNDRGIAEALARRDTLRLLFKETAKHKHRGLTPDEIREKLPQFYAPTQGHNNIIKDKATNRLYRDLYYLGAKITQLGWMLPSHPLTRAARQREFHPEQLDAPSCGSGRIAIEHWRSHYEAFQCVDWCDAHGTRHHWRERCERLRRMLPAKVKELREQAPCVWQAYNRRRGGGEPLPETHNRLYRDLRRIGAVNLPDGTWVKGDTK